ncbi:MAG TPA: hypothetical protein VIL48_18890 [Acidimicrobiales bacterium]
MSRRRRRKNKSSESQQSPQSQQQAKSKAAAAADAFWGDVDGEAESDGIPAVERIRPTPDPGALPRSLGDPPLTPDTAAAHHVAVVYEEAVRAATALAAANGLLDLDDEP